MSKTVACVIARTVSTRLPRKVLREVLPGSAILDYMLQRLKRCDRIDAIYLCTSDEAIDDELVEVAARNEVELYRGSGDKVIERMLDVGEATDADNLIRITGDNVFTSYEYIDAQIAMLDEHQLDYVRLSGVPVGATAEVIRRDALKHCYEAMDPSVSEYLMLFIFDPDTYRCGVIKPLPRDCSNYTLTVDTPADLERTHAVLAALPENERESATLEQLIRVVDEHDIANARFEPAGEIKYPYGKIISFAEYETDMARRIAGSVVEEIA